MLHVSRS